MENYEKRIPVAKANFEKAKLTDRITLLEGDAVEIMAGLDGPFDMIFIDSAKGQYINMLESAIRLLPPGGLLISDNVLQDGDIITAVNGKPVKNLAEFYNELANATKSINFDVYSNGGTITTGTFKF